MLAVTVLVALAVNPVPAGAQETPAPDTGPLVLRTFAGTGDDFNSGDGGLARRAGLASPLAVATAPNGTVYVHTGAAIRAIAPETRVIRTVAGTGEPGFSGDGGPATEATLGAESCGSDAGGMAVGPDGTLYFVEGGSNRVRAIDPTGIIRTVAGNGERGFSGDGGKATEATMRCPKDVAVGEDGTVFVIDTYNYRIRAIDPRTGVIRTVAGQDNPGSHGSDFFHKPDDAESGVATRTFIDAEAIEVGPDGRLYLVEPDDDRVRAIDLAHNKITTVAGDGAAVGNELDRPTELAVAGDGTIYILAEAGNGRGRQVFRLDGSGTRMELFAGAAKEPLSKAGGRPPLGDGGAPTAAFLQRITSIAVGPDGAVYLADLANARVRVVEPRRDVAPAIHPRAGQKIVTIAGSGRQESDDEEHSWLHPGVLARDEVNLDTTADIAVGADGSVYIADTGNHRILAADPDTGGVRTIAGTGEISSDPAERDGAQADELKLYKPVGLALGRDGTLYFIESRFTNSEQHVIYAVDLEKETVRPVPGGDDLGQPNDLAVGPDGALYAADTVNDRICRLPPKGADCNPIVARKRGQEHQRRMPSAEEIAIGPDGTLYLAGGSVVHALDPATGEVETLAGVHMRHGSTGDGLIATSAEIGKIGGIAIDREALLLYISDEANHRLRVIDLKTRRIQAVTGGGPGPGFSGDGGPARAAELSQPSALAVSPGGAIYLYDSANSRVRAIGDVPIHNGLLIHPAYYFTALGLLMLAGGILVLVTVRHRKVREPAEAEQTTTRRMRPSACFD